VAWRHPRAAEAHNGRILLFHVSEEPSRNMFIVFDLDGTLIDSQRDLADATNALLEEYGKVPLPVADIAAMVGEGAAVLVRRALTAAGLNPDTPGALDRFLAHYDQRLTVHTRPYAGIPELLSALRSEGHRLAVLTNKPQHATHTILARLGLAASFSDVVGGDTSAGRKPDPAGLLAMIARAKTVPSSTVLVGDSPIDLETARRAGTRICLARYGFGFRFAESAFRGDERFVEEPSQIAAIVRSNVADSN
jgi:phosphoglycolate phosphatase